MGKDELARERQRLAQQIRDGSHRYDDLRRGSVNEHEYQQREQNLQEAKRSYREISSVLGEDGSTERLRKRRTGGSYKSTASLTKELEGL